MKFTGFSVLGADGREISFARSGEAVHATRPLNGRPSELPKDSAGLRGERELLGIFHDGEALGPFVFGSRTARAVFGVVVKRQEQLPRATNSELAELTEAIRNLF